jgi:hypothetical protein
LKYFFKGLLKSKLSQKSRPNIQIMPKKPNFFKFFLVTGTDNRVPTGNC